MYQKIYRRFKETIEEAYQRAYDEVFNEIQQNHDGIYTDEEIHEWIHENIIFTLNSVWNVEKRITEYYIQPEFNKNLNWVGRKVE